MSDQSAQVQSGFGPAIPSPSASVVLRPLSRDSVTITSGLLHEWQERNRSASLPLALRQLDTAGNLANLRLAISHGEGEYHGPQFMDSDLYKTLEAIAWEVSRAPSWTEFLAALIFLTNDSLFTLPVALINVESGNYGAVNYGLPLAGAVIAMIPCVVVYVSLQRFYVRGLVSGALKG